MSLESISVNASRKYGISNKNVKILVQNLKKEFNFSISNLDINIVDKETLLNINIKFLGHNYDTDIITFNYSENINILDGELLISFDMAKENAERFKCSLNSELIRLIIHGILHMLGYDDINEADKKKMKRKENLLVKKFENIKILDEK